MNTNTKAKTSGWAIAALIGSILCMPIGLVLGIVALVKIGNAKGALGGRGLAIAAVVISGLMGPMVIGILAAIAIPNFVRYQNRAKSSEARMNLSRINSAQEMRKIEWGRYVRIEAAPAGIPGKKPRAWADAACDSACATDNLKACEVFACLDWRPMSNSYYAYACEVSSDGDNFTCAALSDLDGDGEFGMFVYGTGEGRLVAPIPDFGGKAPACAPVPGQVFNCSKDVY
jgi:type II secretory pathway pseudopilin PulG